MGIWIAISEYNKLSLGEKSVGGKINSEAQYMFYIPVGFDIL